jgi:hypothetical protein
MVNLIIIFLLGDMMGNTIFGRPVHTQVVHWGNRRNSPARQMMVRTLGLWLLDGKQRSGQAAAAKLDCRVVKDTITCVV